MDDLKVIELECVKNIHKYFEFNPLDSINDVQSLKEYISSLVELLREYRHVHIELSLGLGTDYKNLYPAELNLRGGVTQSIRDAKNKWRQRKKEQSTNEVVKVSLAENQRFILKSEGIQCLDVSNSPNSFQVVDGNCDDNCNKGDVTNLSEMASHQTGLTVSLDQCNDPLFQVVDGYCDDNKKNDVTDLSEMASHQNELTVSLGQSNDPLFQVDDGYCDDNKKSDVTDLSVMASHQSFESDNGGAIPFGDGDQTFDQYNIPLFQVVDGHFDDNYNKCDAVNLSVMASHQDFESDNSVNVPYEDEDRTVGQSNVPLFQVNDIYCDDNCNKSDVTDLSVITIHQHVKSGKQMRARDCNHYQSSNKMTHFGNMDVDTHSSGFVDFPGAATHCTLFIHAKSQKKLPLRVIAVEKYSRKLASNKAWFRAWLISSIPGIVGMSKWYNLHVIYAFMRHPIL